MINAEHAYVCRQSSSLASEGINWNKAPNNPHDPLCGTVAQASIVSSILLAYSDSFVQFPGFQQ